MATPWLCLRNIQTPVDFAHPRVRPQRAKNLDDGNWAGPSGHYIILEGISYTWPGCSVRRWAPGGGVWPGTLLEFYDGFAYAPALQRLFSLRLMIIHGVRLGQAGLR